ncbi:hypothetical protein [Salinarimonas soli]|uniref:Uncharacterized protein n=1 Tax=Salinarimonas soli TaxID=1638099 RepID=A0A5B2VH22_9HYPH|nr:hypothetical protein [Salinarimonas soli]KAA2238235.1 hypothetical protein F0L46_06205 [Salinarimonas soli]
MTTIFARPAPRPSAPLERLRRRLLEPFFTRLGYDLVPAVPEWEHRPLSRREVDRLVTAAARGLSADMAAAGLTPREAPEATVAAFLDLIRTCPVRQKRGGNGFNGALQVYAVVRALQPSVIVESGVFRGLTTWLMRQAAPDATILCFDPNLGNLHYRDPAARYSTDDWSSADLSGLDTADALAFFDDHISQARRILESSDRGFRRVLFDDNAAAHRIHGHGGPAHPTLSMVLDDDPGEPIRWRRNGREFAYVPDPALLAEARSRIALAHDFDDLHAATGYSPARISYVALRA